MPYAVYIMANIWRTLYTGSAANLPQRVWQHKQKVVPGFTKRYDLSILVYYETGDDKWGALEREKQLKGWRRSRKVALIESVNPEWKDVSDGWFDETWLK